LITHLIFAPIADSRRCYNATNRLLTSNQAAIPAVKLFMVITEAQFKMRWKSSPGSVTLVNNTRRCAPHIGRELATAKVITLMTRPKTDAISPCFIVSNVDQTIAFYCGKLGFETRLREPDKDPFFGIIGRDRAQILIKSDKDVSPLPNSKRHRYMRWDAFVYASEPDALAAEFADHGAAFSEPLKDTHDGLRGFEICDPDGYVLFFGRPR
jgi:catechol 2,3-dioxygenase-like lactoylglutathione lyase family enzyme